MNKTKAGNPQWLILLGRHWEEWNNNSIMNLIEVMCTFFIEFGIPVKLVRLITIHLMELAEQFILINSYLMQFY
jgi:hypothetical protein